MSDWWKTFFKPSVYPLADLVNEKETEKEIRELLRRRPIPNGAKILDVACGVGRHSLSLARRGYQVTGVDYSSSYLSEAKRRAAAKNINARFLRRDMRKLGFENQFDVVLNLWTSFGYFKNQGDDLLTLKAMFKALKPGGKIVIDIADGNWISRHFKAKEWSETKQGWELESHQLRNGSDPAAFSKWVFIKKNGTASRGESFVRCYDRTRLEKIIKRAGFESISMMKGFFEKRADGTDSRRIMALAQRPN